MPCPRVTTYMFAGPSTDKMQHGYSNHEDAHWASTWLICLLRTKGYTHDGPDMEISFTVKISTCCDGLIVGSSNEKSYVLPHYIMTCIMLYIYGPWCVHRVYHISVLWYTKSRDYFVKHYVYYHMLQNHHMNYGCQYVMHHSMNYGCQYVMHHIFFPTLCTMMYIVSQNHDMIVLRVM